MLKKLSMKQISIIVSVIVFTILLVAVVIILNFTKGDVRVDVLKDKTRVGFVLNGSVDDASWCQSHYTALRNISEDLNLEIVCRENVPEENCLDVIRSLVKDEDCLVIIGITFGYGPYMEQASAEFPDRFFLHATGTSYANNLCSYFGRMYQFRYLSGIVAGMQTQTNSIGYVAAFPISSVNRGINAFTLGVKSVNPDAEVHVRFCSSWTEDEPAYAATEKLIEEYGADVIAMHTDSLAPLDCADKNGVWSIGYSTDNTERYPDSYLTACVWKWDGYYKDQILACLQGKFHGAHSWLGIESGIMELADPIRIGNAVPQCAEPLEKARRSFENYSFDVFYGPVKDRDGNIRIAEGESMSDAKMLDNFDWYVEGVEID